MTQSAIDVLIAKDAIRDVLYKCARMYDRKEDLHEEVFWEDATEDHGGYVGSHVGFNQVVGPKFREVGIEDNGQYIISNILIDVRGDIAYSEAYIECHRLMPPGPDAKAVEWVGHGRYADRLEQRDGAWKINHRIVIMDWHDTRTINPNDVNGTWGRVFASGQRDKTDLSYPEQLDASRMRARAAAGFPS